MAWPGVRVRPRWRIAAGAWTDHGINDCWPESSDRRIHAHTKPHVLTERLIRAATRRGDVVIDPCAGGYGVLEACRASGREFVGGDLL
jgi:site-specific DNA-methyltransferase (adenine-specific)